MLLFKQQKSELHVSTCYQCLYEAMKQLHFKSTIKCFKEVKIDKLLDLPYSLSPIDCCFILNYESDHLFIGDIPFSHRYFESDRMNFKNFVFLAVYWSI